MMVPLTQTTDLASKLTDLEINQGWLVDRLDKSNLPVDQKALKTIPEVTYLTLQMKIAPLTLPAATGSEGGDGGAKSPRETTKGKG